MRRVQKNMISCKLQGMRCVCRPCRVPGGINVSRLRQVQIMIIAIAIVIAFSTPASISASASGNESQQHTYIITFKPSAPGQKNDKGTDLAKAMDDEKIKKIKSIPGKLKYNYKIINAIAMDLPDSAVEALKSRDDIESILPDTTAYADLNEVPEPHQCHRRLEHGARIHRSGHQRKRSRFRRGHRSS